MAAQRNKKGTPKTRKEIVVVESGFLLGLRKSDPRHTKIIHVLEKHRKDETLRVSVLCSSVIEVRSVLYSRGFSPGLVEETFSTMALLLASYGVVNFIPAELDDVILAERMRIDTPELGFYDSLHASIAKRLPATLLSSERIYQKLGIDFSDLDSF